MSRKQYKRKNQEKQIRDKEIRPLLEGLGWLVELTHGNRYMSGFPDLYLSHMQFGIRWVDVKVENDYEFTLAQRRKWPKWHQHGSGIWIMTAATQEQYELLFKPPNWINFWKKKYGDPMKEFDLDTLLNTISEE